MAFESGDVPLLPDATAAAASAASARATPDTSLTLDELGPVIGEFGAQTVNADGTLSRIANWAVLTDQERAVTLKRIQARNKKRTEALKAADDSTTVASGGDGGGDGPSNAATAAAAARPE